MAKLQQSGDEQHKRNKAKAEPNAVSKEWEDIFQAIGHPSFILKPDHTIIAFNKAVAAITGKSAEQLIGKKCCDLFHEKNKPPGNCPMEKLLKSGRFETVEMEMEALDRTFLVSCTPVLDKSGGYCKNHSYSNGHHRAQTDGGEAARKRVGLPNVVRGRSRRNSRSRPEK